MRESIERVLDQIDSPQSIDFISNYLRVNFDAKLNGHSYSYEAERMLGELKENLKARYQEADDLQEFMKSVAFGGSL